MTELKYHGRIYPVEACGRFHPQYRGGSVLYLLTMKTSQAIVRAGTGAKALGVVLNANTSTGVSLDNLREILWSDDAAGRSAREWAAAQCEAAASSRRGRGPTGERYVNMAAHLRSAKYRKLEE